MNRPNEIYCILWERAIRELPLQHTQLVKLYNQRRRPIIANSELRITNYPDKLRFIYKKGERLLPPYYLFN